MAADRAVADAGLVGQGLPRAESHRAVHAAGDRRQRERPERSAPLRQDGRERRGEQRLARLRHAVSDHQRRQHATAAGDFEELHAGRRLRADHERVARLRCVQDQPRTDDHLRCDAGGDPREHGAVRQSRHARAAGPGDAGLAGAHHEHRSGQPQLRPDPGRRRGPRLALPHSDRSARHVQSEPDRIVFLEVRSSESGRLVLEHQGPGLADRERQRRRDPDLASLSRAELDAGTLGRDHRPELPDRVPRHSGHVRGPDGAGIQAAAGERVPHVRSAGGVHRRAAHAHRRGREGPLQSEAAIHQRGWSELLPGRL